ncbi:MAG: PEP-CTERM sorting domain-containing protein [Xanthomonadales bacterium]|nr:PEP-CTERM sorting domain-containing protein [Xanthomonadales bacterium]
MKTDFRVLSGARIALATLGLGVASSAFAVPYYYTDWLSANPSAGTAHGVITLPDASTVSVDFTAVYADGSPGSFVGAYTAGNWAGWAAYPSAYTSTEVDNLPLPDMLQLAGGQNQIYKVHLGAPIKDPLMDIVSLGSPAITTQYSFDVPFTILSQGTDYWGGCNTCLQQSGNNLIGSEGSGAIKFVGTYSDFSWTVPVPEYWHGFTFGIRTTEALEPGNDVPEPSPAPLFGLGLGGIGLILLKRRLDRRAMRTMV